MSAKDRQSEGVGKDRATIWRILRSSGVTSGATAITLLCHVAGVMLVARLVEKDVFGTYLLILAVAQAAKIFGGLGLDATLVRHFASADSRSRPAAFANVIVLRVVGVATVCVLLAAAAEPLAWLSPGLPAHLGYVLVIAALGSGRELLLAALQGIFAFGRYAGALVVPAVLRLVGIAALFAAGRDELIDLLRLELAVLALSLVVVVRLLPLRQLIRGWAVERQLLRRLLAFGALLYVNSIGSFLSTRLNLFLLAGLTNPVQLANYGVASQIPDGCARLFRAMVMAYFPFASRLSDSADRREARNLVAFALALAAFGNMLPVMIAVLFGHDLLTVLFGTRYAPAATVFTVLVASYCMQSLASVMGYSLVAAGYPGVSTRINAVGMVLLLSGSLAAVPAFGAIGAAGAQALANTVILLLGWRALCGRGLEVGGATFLTPMALGLFFLGLGQVIAGDSITIRLAAIGLYALICGATVKELRISMRFIARECAWLLRLPWTPA